MTPKSHAEIEKNALKMFRHIVYRETELRKGDLTNTLKAGMLDSIIKNSGSLHAISLAARIKSQMEPKRAIKQ